MNKSPDWNERYGVSSHFRARSAVVSLQQRRDQEVDLCDNEYCLCKKLIMHIVDSIEMSRQEHYVL
jgi:hypothetical protein